MYVKVKPNQRFDRVEKTDEGWQVRLKAPAINGKANLHLLTFLSSVLGISKSKIILRKGHTSKLKCIEIECAEELVFRKMSEAAVQADS